MKKALIALAALTLSPAAFAAEITVNFSSDFQEKLNEDYGVKEGEFLAGEIREDLEAAFAKAGVTPARVEVTILDAKPNKPTRKQLSDEPALDYFRSISIGGAKLEGVAYDEAGNEIGRMEYKWYENSIANVIGYGTWHDADRVSRRFATRLAKDIAES